MPSPIKKDSLRSRTTVRLFLDEIGELDISLQAKIFVPCKSIRSAASAASASSTSTSASSPPLIATCFTWSRKNAFARTFTTVSTSSRSTFRRFANAAADIPILIEHFVNKHTRGTHRKITFTPDARHLLEDYSYPGNIRQLESALERAISSARMTRSRSRISPPEMVSGNSTAAGAEAVGEFFKLPPEGVNFEDVERSLIMQAMARTDNNITEAAKLLGLTFETLQYRLEKFGFQATSMERRRVRRRKFRVQASACSTLAGTG